MLLNSVKPQLVFHKMNFPISTPAAAGVLQTFPRLQIEHIELGKLIYIDRNSYLNDARPSEIVSFHPNFHAENLMPDTATNARLIFNDGTSDLEFPVKKAMIGADVIDIRSLYAQTGKPPSNWQRRSIGWLLYGDDFKSL